MADVIEVGATVSRTYHVLLDHLKRERDVRIKRFSEPSLIEADVGSSRYWWGYRRNAPGSVKIDILPKDGESLVNFNFDFTTLYLKVFVIVALVVLFSYLFVSYYLGSRYYLVWVSPLIGAIFIFAYAIPRDVSTQKKKIIGRVRDFLKMQAKKLN